MSKGKKQAITLISLCLLMILGIVAYFLVPQGEEKEEDTGEEATQTIEVVSIDGANITGLQILSEEENISLEKKENTWKLTDIPEAPVDQEAVEGMFSAFQPVKATKKLDGANVDMAEYGLDKPAKTLQVTTKDGKTYEIKLGEVVPATGGNYGLYDGQLYTFEDTFYAAFEGSKNSLISKEGVASITADYMTSIEVEKEGKTTFRAEVVSDDKKVDAYTNWVISEPFEKPLAGSSTEDWGTLQGYFSSVSFDELVEYGAKDLEKYGLKNPGAVVKVNYFTLKDGYEEPEATANPNGTAANNNTNKANVIPKKYQDGKSYTLSVGDETEDGESYYVRWNDSKQVYTLKADTVNQMIDADAYTYMDRCVYSTLATDIKGYDATIGDKKISVTRKDGKNEEGKDINIWTLNGKKVSDENEETFLTPYTKGYLLEFTSEAKDDVKPKSKEPVMQIVFHEANRDVTVTYYPYDGTNFYRVDKDGMDYFLVDKRSVDDMISAYEALLELDQ